MATACGRLISIFAQILSPKYRAVLKRIQIHVNNSRACVYLSIEYSVNTTNPISIIRVLLNIL